MNATTVQDGVIILLVITPILVVVVMIILRCTRRMSEEAEALVRSAEESHIAAFLERNGPAIIRRLGDNRRQADDGGQPAAVISDNPLLEGGGSIDVDTLEVQELEDDEDEGPEEEPVAPVVIKTQAEPVEAVGGIKPLGYE